MAARADQPQESAFFLKNFSVRYAAPEVCYGWKVGPKELMMADVYSLALICYEVRK